VLLLGPALAALQAPSGSPPDVSARLLGMCDVVDACECLDTEAVVGAAYRLMHPSSAGEQGVLPTAQQLLRSSLESVLSLSVRMQDTIVE